MPQTDVLRISNGRAPVEVGGVGTVDEQGVPLSVCAERMPELKGADGKPLTGAALQAAAKAWAEKAGHGLQVAKASTPGGKPEKE